MIITLICLALFVIGVVLLIIAVSNDWDDDIIQWFIALPTGIALVATVVCGVSILTTKVGRNIEYEKKLHERNMLVYRLEQAEEDNNIVEYAELYNDIVCFNNSIRKTKAWHDNPWVNWFYNPLLADLEYIEVTDTDADQ